MIANSPAPITCATPDFLWFGERFPNPPGMLANSRLGRDTAKPRVLVVDDERLIADTLAEILNDEGFEATAVYDAKTAIKWAQASCPDVLLTDVVMPETNGIELAQFVQKTCPHTRILLLSGQAATSQLLEKGQAQGLRFELLAKPIQPEKLLELLRE